MIYPNELLPQSDYKLIDFESLDCLSDLIVLCRQTKDSNFIAFDSDNSEIIKSEYISIETDHLRDFSTNLFGIFNENHFGIEWSKNAKTDGMFDNWEENNEIVNPVFEEHFYINPKKSAFFLKLNDFQNKFIPNDQNDEILSKVIHTPCNCNFWHFSIRWLINGIDSSELPKTKRRSVLSIARTQISLSGQSEPADFNILDSKCYQK
ncbi:MAG: hypothetical protein CFE22_02570 [Cytophagaceae bacterium BCCC1]|nr:MAG: hypothetical protein CFE22_02570 [Cytophagaceae bacterium BCCC1]